MHVHYKDISRWYDRMRYLVFCRNSHLLFPGNPITFLAALFSYFFINIFKGERWILGCTSLVEPILMGIFIYCVFVSKFTLFLSIISHTIDYKSKIHIKWYIQKNSVVNVESKHDYENTFCCVHNRTRTNLRNGDFTRCSWWNHLCCCFLRFFFVSIFLLVGLNYHTIYFRFFGFYLHHL